MCKCVLFVLLLSACVSQAPQTNHATPVAHFAGHVDTDTHTVTFDADRVSQSLTEIPVTGGDPDSVQLYTLVTYYDTDGMGGCGRANSFCGTVEMVSSYTTATLSNVYVEITSITPVENAAYNSDTATMGLSDAYGLWGYGTLAPDGGNATRDWGFNAPSAARFDFVGRVMADVSP